MIHGTVTGTPEWKGASYARHLVFPLRTERLLLEEKEHEVTGHVRVNLYAPGKEPRIGDRLVIGGKISIPKGRTNPAGFDYRTYLKRMGMQAVMVTSENDHYFKTGINSSPVISFQRFLSRTRDRADHIIYKHLSGTPRDIVRSVILGLRGKITDEVNDAFMKTGTMHILAVSGLHIGIVAMALMGLLRLTRCPKKLTYFLTILGICAFAAFTGGRPSSVRAALMGSFILFGLALERKTDIVGALALSAFVIKFFRPVQLFQAGFILSYMAVISIIYITPLTDKLFGIKKREYGESRITVARRYVLKSLSVSLAVWIGMIPVIATYFRIITPSVVLSNLLAVPVLTVMVVLGFALVFTGSFALLAPLAHFLSGILSHLIPVFMKTIQMIAHAPCSFVRIPSPHKFLMITYYIALAGTMIMFNRHKKYGKLILIFLLFAANLFLWQRVIHKPPEKLRVTFFDTGKSDASILQFSDGSVMMIDGGSGGQGTGNDAGRRILAPYLWQNGITRIDCVLLTHAHEDHIGGLLYILKNFDIGTVVDAGGVSTDTPEMTLYQKLHHIIVDNNITYKELKSGDIIKGFPGIDLAVLNPPQTPYGGANEDSVVVKALTDNGNSILFCGDIGSTAMKDMLRFGPLLESDLVKAPHHGAGSDDMYIVKEFLKETACAAAVITNSSPEKVNKEILKLFADQNTTVHITATSGAVIAEETENGFRVTEYRNKQAIEKIHFCRYTLFTSANTNRNMPEKKDQ